MKNKEKILRYLAGEMNKPEREQFESEERRSGELNEDLDAAVDLITQIKNLSDIEVNETYFSSLVPKIRNRIEKSEKRKKVYRVSIAFTLLVIILAGIYFSGNQRNEVLLSDAEMEKIINDEIPHDFITDVLITGTIDLTDTEVQIGEFDITEDYLNGFSESDFIQLFNSLSDDELNELSEYLTKTKNL